jgi:hypothetical protein
LLSGLATAILFGLVLLGFGITPTFPPAIAFAIGVILIALMLVLLPRFYAHEGWTIWHQVGLIYGAIIANMAVFFVGFIDATPLDFYGKVVLDGTAIAFLLWIALRLRNSQEESQRVLCKSQTAEI